VVTTIATIATPSVVSHGTALPPSASIQLLNRPNSGW
jgi:hypothetical protein